VQLDPISVTADPFEAAMIADSRREAQSTALWRMTQEERVLAMRRGELSLGQLTEWSSTRPQEVPLLGGEFEYIVVFLADWIEHPERSTTGREAPAA